MSAERFGPSDPATASATSYIAERHIAPLLLDPASRARLLEEHRRLPLALPGRDGAPARTHSPGLARVLDWLRCGPLEGKYVLLRCPRCDGLRVARMGAPGASPVVVEERCHADPAAAEHAVFVRRVHDFLVRHAAVRGDVA